MPPACTGLAAGKAAPPFVLSGNEPSNAKLCCARKLADFAFAAEAEVFELDRHHDRIVVVGLDEIEVRRAARGIGPQAVRENNSQPPHNGSDFACRMVVLLIPREHPNALPRGRTVESSRR